MSATNKPNNKPNNKSNNKPDNKPNNKPDNKPDNKPNNKATVENYDITKDFNDWIKNGNGVRSEDHIIILKAYQIALLRVPPGIAILAYCDMFEKLMLEIFREGA